MTSKPETTTGRRPLHIGGIAVRLHPSLLLIVGPVVWSTSTQLREVAGSMLVALVLAVVATVGMFGSILVHELAHARQGHRHHLHVHGVTLFVFGGVTAMDDRIAAPWDEFRIAAVGPWLSLQAAAVFGLVTAGLDWMGWAEPVAAVLGLLGWFNVGLGLFNLLPGAPLDGGRVLQAVLWRVLGDRRRAARLSALVGVLLGLAIWALAGWVVARDTEAIWSALWLTAVAAFIVVLAVRQWRDWRDRVATPDADAGDAWGPNAGDAWGLDGGPATPVGPVPRSRWQWAGVVAGTIAVVVGFAVVPMPFVDLSPGPVTDVGQVIEVSGTTTPVTGEALMVTVQVYHPGMASVLWAAVSDRHDLEPRRAVIPDGVGDRTYFAQQRETFTSSFDMAAAAALRANGEEVSSSVQVVVRTVLAAAPAAGLVLPDDVIVAADGAPLASVEALSLLTADKDVGDTLTLRVDRDGEVVDVDVVVALLPGGERTGIGVSLGTVVTRLDLPREVTTSVSDVGGPSAGLVTALAIYDQVDEQDLLADRRVAASATITDEGDLGRVGGIPQKVRGAIEEGAELLLVHESQVGEALLAADGELPVIGVSTLDQAIARLAR